jgi:hypothetical protein
MENRKGTPRYPVHHASFSRTKGADDAKIEINGMKVMVEKKVPLIQVELTEKKNGKRGSKPPGL